MIHAYVSKIYFALSRDIPRGRYNTPRPVLKESKFFSWIACLFYGNFTHLFVSDQLWRNKLGKLENKKIDKWELNIEIWYPPAQNAIGFIEQVIDSNLTGMVLGNFFFFHENLS